MSVRLSKIPHYFHSSKDYSFSVEHDLDESMILMQVHSEVYTTSMLPSTFSILEKSLPSIFQCECFNDLHQPFSVEVQKTEIAHLFEHILLEYLCALKVENGYKNAVINGVTTWDWRLNPMGSFVIRIDSGMSDREIFATALAKSIALFDYILSSRSFSVN